VHRSEAISWLTEGKKLILIAGSHGKSTTTYMLIRYFQLSSIPLSYLVGAESHELERNGVFSSNSEFFVVEGDESDGTLMNYKPYLLLVNRISDDHMDYFHSMKELIRLFQVVAERAEVVISYDLNPLLVKNEINFGEKNSSEYLLSKNSIAESTIAYGGIEERAERDFLGRHNGVNLLAASSVFHYLFKRPFSELVKFQEEFSHLKRRFELIASVNSVRFYDDYATHHDALKETLDIGLQLSGRVILIFQPVRWSRNKNFTSEFSRLFASFDRVFLYKMEYRIGEEHDYNFQEMLENGKTIFISDYELLREVVIAQLRHGDRIITASGQLSNLARELATDYALSL
jgi:UDP-N-acetylmuramate--alanine ligase